MHHEATASPASLDDVLAYRHPGVRVREHPSFGTRTFGVVHREGAELVPATAALVRELAG